MGAVAVLPLLVAAVEAGPEGQDLRVVREALAGILGAAMAVMVVRALTQQRSMVAGAVLPVQAQAGAQCAVVVAVALLLAACHCLAATAVQVALPELRPLAAVG